MCHNNCAKCCLEVAELVVSRREERAQTHMAMTRSLCDTSLSFSLVLPLVLARHPRRVVVLSPFLTRTKLNPPRYGFLFQVSGCNTGQVKKKKREKEER